MALALFDRVQETTTTTGTGSVTLAGAVPGFQSFAVVGNGNTCYYTIVDGSAWEVGIGTYSTSGPTLARTTVLSNSSGNTSPITLAAGTKSIFLTYPAEKSVNLDASDNVSPLGTVSSGVWQGSTVGVAYGGTGVTTSSGANSVVLRDSNQNIAVNRVNQSNTNTTAAGGTTALTAASSYIHTLVGTGGQTYTLPDATTLTTGVAFVFNNLATGTLTLANFAGTTIGTIPSGGASAVFLTLNSTTGGTWDLHAYLPEGVTFGTNAFNLGTSIISGGTWQGGTIATGYGGTGLTSYTSGGAVYANSSSTLTSGTLPVTAGGTGATTAAGAQSSLNVPSTTGSGASGTWGINITGNAATATTAANYLPLSGGALTGDLQLGGNFLRFDQSGTRSWNIRATGGNLDINSGDGSGSLRYNNGVVLTSNNFNSYAPTLTGTGASGTWGINITGSAASATTAGKTSATTVPASTSFSKWLFATTSTGGVLNWDDSSNTIPGVGTTLLLGTASNGPGGGNYYHPFNIEYASNDGTGQITQMAIAYASPANELFMRGRYAGTWSSWVRYLNSNNYNNFSPTLTGGGASGTWGINITGAAGSAGTASSATIAGLLQAYFGRTDSATYPVCWLANEGAVGPYAGSSRAYSCAAVTITSSSGTLSATNLAATTGAFSGALTAPQHYLNRAGTAQSGLSWYSGSYTAWADYMSPAGATGAGPTGNITAPSGTLVTSWALRSFIENVANYGWTFESGSATGQPTVVAEIRSSDGAARFGGTVTAPTFSGSLSGNSTTTSQRAFSGDISTTGQGRFTGWYAGGASTALATEVGVSGGQGYVLCYSRDSGTYATLNIAGSASNLQISGSTVNVTSGALQQGGSQVLTAGNVSSYAVPARGQSSWNDNTVINNVVGMLAWKNYGNSHVIFDASQSTTPSGSGCNNTNPAVNWSATYPTLMGWNGGSTYGLRVDSTRTSDQLGGYAASTFVGQRGSTYNQVDTWLQLNGFFGLYAPSANGAHWYPNNASTYTTWAISGSRNGYSGIFDTYSSVAGFMYDSAGNGGVYREANGRWYFYHNLSNNCMGIGTSATSSSYGIYVIKGVYSEGNVVAYSDERVKTNWRDYPADFVEQLAEVKHGTYDRTDIELTQDGVSAQSLHTLLPYSAPTDEHDKMSVNYGGAALVAAIQLAKRVLEQDKRIAALEALVAKCN
jgi:hypothetical protein